MIWVHIITILCKNKSHLAILSVVCWAIGLKRNLEIPRQMGRSYDGRLLLCQYNPHDILLCIQQISLYFWYTLWMVVLSAFFPIEGKNTVTMNGDRYRTLITIFLWFQLEEIDLSTRLLNWLISLKVRDPKRIGQFWA